MIFIPLFFLILIQYTMSKDVFISSDGTIDLKDNDNHVFVIKEFGKEIDNHIDLINFGKMFGTVDKVISGTPHYLSNKIVHSPGFEDGDEHCMFKIKPTEYYTRIVKDPGDDLAFGEGWHSDLSYLENPPTFSIVRAVELPGNKTSTMFKDMGMVFRDFPNNERLVNLMANHSDDFNTSSMHPVVKDGKLFVNQAFTRNIIGDEDNKLLDEILSFIDNHSKSEVVIDWTIDDIIIWNNDFLFHSANYNYPKDQRREIQRVVVQTI